MKEKEKGSPYIRAACRQRRSVDSGHSEPFASIICVRSAYIKQNPAAWPTLPDSLKGGILAMVKAAGK